MIERDLELLPDTQPPHEAVPQLETGQTLKLFFIADVKRGNPFTVRQSLLWRRTYQIIEVTMPFSATQNISCGVTIIFCGSKFM